jgi:hypothetical protein
VNTYPVGTGEYVYVSVTKRGPGAAPYQAVTDGVLASVVPTGESPGTFNPTTIADGYPAVDVSTLSAGTYDVYVKATDPSTGRTPIIRAGTILMK